MESCLKDLRPAAYQIMDEESIAGVALGREDLALAAESRSRPDSVQPAQSIHCGETCL